MSDTPDLYTPTDETVFECFLDGAEGNFIRKDLERYFAARDARVRAEAQAEQREADVAIAERAGERPEVVPIEETVRRHAYIKGREIATRDILAAIRGGKS